MDQVKQATSEFASYDPGTETGKLAAERKEAAKKIHEAAKQRAAEKREAEQKDVSQKETTASASKPAVKAPVAKKSPIQDISE
jgi:sec-independent protein translocase protein TatB